MHCVVGIWQFEVKIFINKTSSVGQIMCKIILVHVVVMDEASPVEVLGFEVKPDIVEVSWPNFVIGRVGVTEVLGKG